MAGGASDSHTAQHHGEQRDQRKQHRREPIGVAGQSMRQDQRQIAVEGQNITDIAGYCDGKPEGHRIKAHQTAQNRPPQHQAHHAQKHRMNIDHAQLGCRSGRPGKRFDVEQMGAFRLNAQIDGLHHGGRFKIKTERYMPERTIRKGCLIAGHIHTPAARHGRIGFIQCHAVQKSGAYAQGQWRAVGGRPNRQAQPKDRRRIAFRQH